ncbi:MAG TPA: adenylate/guanylate cyclase domain-containing protein [Dehalococcoidia bacterium]
MQARVQYVTTADGTDIAYSVTGSGPPLIYLNAWPFEHVGLEWQQPDYRLLYGELIQHFTLIRFDGRGCGMSSPDVADLSLDARVGDLEALVEHLGVNRFSMVGFSTSGPLAIAYTAQHQAKVAKLVLYDTCASLAAVADEPQFRAFQTLLRANFEFFTETLCNVGYGWSAGEPARRFAKFLRECVTHENAIRSFDSMREIDVTALLPSIAVPTLVLQHNDLPFPDVNMAHQLVANLPDASLMVLEGNYGKNPAAERYPIVEFLTSKSIEQPAAQTSLVTIMFTDITDSTSLTQRVGDERSHEMVQVHNRIVREAMARSGGREIKHTGDGIMAAFGSAVGAVECSIGIQRELAQHNEAAPDPFQMRIGLNAGEPVADGNDLFGTAVQLAARVCSHASGEQVLVSDVVRQLVAGRQFMFSQHDDVELRGFEDPVRLFEVKWTPEAKSWAG